MSKHMKLAVAMALMAGLPSTAIQLEPDNSEYKPKPIAPRVKRHQGAKECARRLKQVKP